MRITAKHISILMMIFMGLVTFSSCGNDDSGTEEQVVADYKFQVSGSAIIEADGQVSSNTIVVQVSNTDWTVGLVSGSEWLTCQKNGNSVLLSAEPNTNADSREAVLVFTELPASLLEHRITVTQKGAELPSGPTPTKDQYVTNGALPGVFHVSPTKTVHFSQGNLQYNPKQNKWRFASEQYIHTNKESYSNISSSDNVWYTKFTWGQSGYNGNSITGGGYPRAMFSINTISGTNYDWGVYNAISNGGNMPNQWFTMTADEWNYLLTHHSHAYATVNGEDGVFLIPDDFECPKNISISIAENDSLGSCRENNNLVAFYNKNIQENIKSYSLAQMTWLEAAGVVFLPNGSSWYVTASADESNSCHNPTEWVYCVLAGHNYINWIFYGNPKNYRYMVRLVQ